MPHSAVAARSSLIAGWKRILAGVEHLRGTPELLVEPAERRAAVAGDVAGGTLADTRSRACCMRVEADDRLRAGDEDPALEEVVFVVEGDRLEAHCFLRRLPVRPP